MKMERLPFGESHWDYLPPEVQEKICGEADRQWQRELGEYRSNHRWDGFEDVLEQIDPFHGGLFPEANDKYMLWLEERASEVHICDICLCGPACQVCGHQEPDPLDEEAMEEYRRQRVESLLGKRARSVVG